MERLYLDTSVFGGYFDPEFELWSKILFDRIKEGKHILMYSLMTDNELSNAPEPIKKLIIEIPDKQIEIVDINEQVLNLADQYIAEKVVGKTSRADCIHIALATINVADILVSWNFKHIVNINRIRGYNTVNTEIGYPKLEIRTPREILEYED
ncbi:MAG: hypothetical protein WD053_08225 [Gracilimonas sp.]